jgi:DNA uptake protein ComE-like DNA-binding protein
VLRRVEEEQSAEPEPPSAPDQAPPGAKANLNSSDYDELRAVGMSVTQANRVIAYRARLGGYSSADDLERVPGFPTELIEELRARLET